MLGEVWILCGAGVSCKCFLTQTQTSFHTRDVVMDVREVLLENPLPNEASGFWVVRGDKVCGYVVAVTGLGLSCFMVAMERALNEMEAVLGRGRKIKFGRELNDMIQQQRLRLRLFTQPRFDSQGRIKGIEATEGRGFGSFQQLASLCGESKQQYMSAENEDKISVLPNFGFE